MNGKTTQRVFGACYTEDEAELIIRGLKRLLSYLKMTDDGSITKSDQLRECKQLIEELEAFINGQRNE